MSEPHRNEEENRGVGASREPPSPAVEIAQEDDRVGGRRVAIITLVAALVMLAGIASAGWIAHVTIRGLGREHVVTQTHRAPREVGIVDQTLIENDAYGQRLRESQRRSLDRYGWVDRASGVARIPIDRAIDLVVEQERSP